MDYQQAIHLQYINWKAVCDALAPSKNRMAEAFDVAGQPKSRRDVAQIRKPNTEVIKAIGIALSRAYTQENFSIYATDRSASDRLRRVGHNIMREALNESIEGEVYVPLSIVLGIIDTLKLSPYNKHDWESIRQFFVLASQALPESATYEISVGSKQPFVHRTPPASGLSKNEQRILSQVFYDAVNQKAATAARRQCQRIEFFVPFDIKDRYKERVAQALLELRNQKTEFQIIGTTSEGTGDQGGTTYRHAFFVTASQQLAFLEKIRPIFENAATESGVCVRLDVFSNLSRGQKLHTTSYLSY